MKRARTFILITLLVIAGAACATESDAESPQAGPETNSRNNENPPPDDVTLGACTNESFGGPTARGTLLNHSSKLSNYIIEVNFTDDAGTIMAQATGFASNIPPGATANWEAVSLSDYASASCTVAKVDRYSAI